MKRKIIFIVAVILILTMCTCIFTACPSNEPSDETQDKGTNNETPNNSVKHYEIQLTKNNFEEYLDYKVTTNATSIPRSDFYEIKGVLSYAYYKDVSITFHVEYSRSNGMNGENVYQGNYIVKLNAAGCKSFYTNDEAILKAINLTRYDNMITKRTLTITAVSGTVIFDI